MMSTIGKSQLKKIVILVGCLLMCGIFILLPIFIIYKNINKQPIVVEALETVPVNFSTPTSGRLLTEEKFNTLQSAGLMQQFETYESYQASGTGSTMSISTSDITADGVNREIYDIVDANFNVYYGEMRISPILPMAISNVETPGRADRSVTWSAIFPSAIVPIEYLNTFQVTDVISNQEWYSKLSAEYSTRDRGCLQMSPSYGTNNKTLNSMMSGTEKDKLSTVDTANYAVWVAGASDKAGDRFYLPDVCLRMTAAFQTQTLNMQKNNYLPKTDMQLIAMLAVSHQSSGVWHNCNHNAAVGKWKSGQACYDWCALISQQNVIDKLTDLAMSSDACFIDTSTANSICSELGINNYSDFSTKSIVCTYPIKVLYAYIKLCMLYTR